MCTTTSYKKSILCGNKRCTLPSLPIHCLRRILPPLKDCFTHLPQRILPTKLRQLRCVHYILDNDVWCRQRKLQLCTTYIYATHKCRIIQVSQTQKQNLLLYSFIYIYKQLRITLIHAPFKLIVEGFVLRFAAFRRPVFCLFDIGAIEMITFFPL